MIHVKGNLHDLLRVNRPIANRINAQAYRVDYYRGLLALCNEVTNHRVVGHLKTLKKWKNTPNARFGPNWDRERFQSSETSNGPTVWGVDYRKAITSEHRTFWLSEVGAKYLNQAHKNKMNMQWMLPDVDAMIRYIEQLSGTRGYLIFLPPFFGNKRLKNEAITRLQQMAVDHVLVTPQGPQIQTHQLVYSPSTGLYSVQTVAQPSPAPAVRQ